MATAQYSRDLGNMLHDSEADKDKFGSFKYELQHIPSALILELAQQDTVISAQKGNRLKAK